jgi:hypothetical protein
MATALLQLDKENEAKTVLLGLLEMAIADHRQDKLLYALVGIALLLSKQGIVLMGVEVFSLAKRFPFVGHSRWFLEVFGNCIERWAQKIPKPKVNEAKHRGANRDLWETADELVLALG